MQEQIDEKQTQTKGKEFLVSEDMKELAKTILKEQKLDIRPAKVEYLLVYPNITKSQAAKCFRTGKELKFFTDFDYIVEISGELWDALEYDDKYILLYHELLHIMPIMDEKSGEWKMKMRNHNIQDFSVLIKKYGIEWIDRIRFTLSSIYSMTPTEEDNVKF
jgi:predicted metallopeptidase